MCYILMDLSWQAVQTNGKFYSNFAFVFELLAKKKNIQQITRLGLWKLGGRDICADQHAF